MSASDVPQIEVSLDNASIHDVSSHPPTSPQDKLFSPRSPRSPISTVESGNVRSSLNIPPPSPTPSIRSSIHSGQSVHFAASRDLRNNDPEREYGHSRRQSFASGTIVPDDNHVFSPEHSDLGHETLRAESITPTVSSNSRNRGGIPEADERTVYQRELDQDKKFNPYPFSFKPFQLAHLVNPPHVLGGIEQQIGGTQALLRGLGTDGERGLSKEALAVNSGVLAYQAVKDKEQRDREKAEKKDKNRWRWRNGAGQGASPQHETELEELRTIPEPSPDVLSASVDERRRVYGPNLLPTRSPKSLLFLMWLALKDKVLVLLFIAAVISLALGLFQDFGASRSEGETPVHWIEGVAIIAAVAIVVIAGSLKIWQKEHQFKRLNDKKEERGIKVIRDGIECVIDSKEVVVGDIALLELGEVVPCDGVLLSGQHVRCDEAVVAGESGVMHKLTYEECVEFFKGDGCLPNRTDCFIVSGSKVVDGVGRYVVIAVGTKSFHRRIMTVDQPDPEPTPLQLKLNALAELIAKLGLSAGFTLFGALMIRFFVQLGRNSPVRTAIEKGITFINIFIISVTLVAVAVPKGLPLVVPLALCFATKNMTRENILVRDIGSCERIANTSVLCIDKTGILTQNLMTVVAGAIGVHAKFVRELDKHPDRHNAEVQDRSLSTYKDGSDFSIDQSQINSVLTPALRKLFNEAIAINSTAFEVKDPKTEESMFGGNKTDVALLQFARQLEWKGYRETRDAGNIVQMISFSSERRAMAVVVRLPHNTGFRVYIKGAPEILLKNCTDHVVVRPSTSLGHWEGRNGVETKAIGTLEENISETIRFYATKALRTIALCYRDFEQWPVGDMKNDVALTRDLTLIAIIAIENPLRPGVREAVSKCYHAGVTIKMCTGDNVETARAVALECGILTPGGSVKEGVKFRERRDVDRIEIASTLQVLARSSPEDKEALVSTLRKTGIIVGMTGDNALKKANVGFSMGLSGTEVAKTTSDMVLTDDSFVSIYKAIMWGRCVNDAVRKCLQFQVTACIAVVFITFVSAVTNTQGLSVLSPVQLLWTNIILDTFAVLALITDPASESLLDRQPNKTAPLFTTDMYKQIFFQSVYQIAIILVLHFFGLKILHLKPTGDNEVDEHQSLLVQTLVFNVFVFIQIFNLVNCRRLDKHLNIFEGIMKNRYFFAIILLEISVQILIVFVAKDAFKVTRIGGHEWGISLGLGVMPIPLGTLIRFLPNEPIDKVFKKLGLLDWPQVLPTVSAEGEARSNAPNIVKQNSGTFMFVRGTS